MSQQAMVVSKETARRFLVRAFALAGFQTLTETRRAVAVLESVQEDSINICGRIHDLVLWPRVKNFTHASLAKLLYEAPRQGVEYYFPNLHILPIEDLPYFRRAMLERRKNEGRWNRLTEEEQPVAARLLKHIEENGPLRTRAAGSDEGHTFSGWGTRTTVAARVAEKLWLHGHLAISRRENFERYFDLWERCFPGTDGLALPDADQEASYLAKKRLRTRRLFRLKKLDHDMLGADTFVRLQIGEDKRPWCILKEDLPLLLDCEKEAVPEVCHLLAPLDPLIYDRDRNRMLWDFDYIWEVYTPAVKRRWGYYVLPILYGDKIVGRVDPKLDRRTSTLKVISLQWEPDTDVAAVLPAVQERLQGFAAFLGADTIELPST